MFKLKQSSLATVYGLCLQKIRDQYGNCPVTRAACEMILQVAPCREQFTHLSAESRGEILIAYRTKLKKEGFLSDIHGATLTPHSITDINASSLTATAEQPAQEIAADVFPGDAPPFP